MDIPRVASRDEWLAAREDLLAQEKAATRAKDAVDKQRRALPMVEIDKDYVFTGPGGQASLADLFDGRRGGVPLLVEKRADAGSRSRHVTRRS